MALLDVFNPGLDCGPQTAFTLIAVSEVMALSISTQEVAVRRRWFEVISEDHVQNNLA